LARNACPKPNTKSRKVPQTCHPISLKIGRVGKFVAKKDSAQEILDFTAPVNDLPSLPRGEIEKLMCAVCFGD
jgi:hypothetical protein